MPLKLLAVGDLHLGRSPAGLPEDLLGEARALGPAGAWRRIVEQAIEADIGALVLAGDVVEQENDFFEAYRALGDGVEKLLAAGIRVLAVAGNHDVQVLPRLADQLEGFDLLGRGGRWERRTLESGSERLTLHGWSFPQRAVTASPLGVRSFERGPGPNLGVLHCDRDRTDSRYAPVPTAELLAAGLDGWLLGHIHRPDPLSREALLGYLGSATGLGAAEHGARGPWLISVTDGEIAAVEQWRIAPLHWERLPIDLTGAAAAEDARELLLERVNALDRALGARMLPPSAVGLRLTFIGRSSLRAKLERMLAEENLSDISASGSGIRYFVERWKIMTEPVLDLAQLSERGDPPGLLARRLRLLERGADDPERRQLIERAREHLAARYAKPYWQPLETGAPDDARVAEWLREAGLAALDELLGQHGGSRQQELFR